MEPEYFELIVLLNKKRLTMLCLGEASRYTQKPTVRFTRLIGLKNQFKLLGLLLFSLIRFHEFVKVCQDDIKWFKIRVVFRTFYVLVGSYNFIYNIPLCKLIKQIPQTEQLA